jgi:hypothetical protein
MQCFSFKYSHDFSIKSFLLLVDFFQNITVISKSGWEACFFFQKKNLSKKHFQVLSYLEIDFFFRRSSSTKLIDQELFNFYEFIDTIYS